MGALWAWGLCALVHPAWVSLVDGWVAVCPIGIQRGSTNGANVVAAHYLGATGRSAGQHVLGQGQWCAMGASGMCTPWVVYRKQQVLGGCVGAKNGAYQVSSPYPNKEIRSEKQETPTT